MTDSNRVVNGLWVGDRLSSLELLTVKSFIAHGHQFRLWAYDDIKTPLPPQVEVLDANAILHQRHLFRYEEDSQFGFGKGSLAGFSDVFRYKLLYDYGGWWIDMDVTCLRPFSIGTDYFFRDHDKFPVVGNVMKCPRRSRLMRRCFESSFQCMDKFNRDWFKAIRILNHEICDAGLMRYRKVGLIPPDSNSHLHVYYQTAEAFPQHWYGVHWCRTGARGRIPEAGSTLRSLFERYGIEDPVPPRIRASTGV